ncbi:grasp-with-spasm system SPASM domain peptide maturase [Chryseobacterium sp. PCH239]|uniref:grasp-with-spasm system SPASM domain peptide maturase n=1 Tax=Chryseobacterium sp. PCH239 TaxID=2825845 RepID=UPI001C10EB20|nr:grasp-with-spasm system SPASM domain peptide maturase [Chryseobacterium sp. PCH239]QWT88088.1 grasp-with-spasm system SPASM domain peptide maturase [Chryseobacterium sp. PCH239]
MKYFNLFSNILVTKGSIRILISDLQRNVSELYPLELFEIIQELKNKSIEDTMISYDEESKEIVENYINLLLEKEYGFVTENGWDRNFPSLSYDYHEPNAITDLFIEMEDLGILKKIYPSIENLGVKYLVIYSLKSLTLKDCIEIDEIFKTSVLSGIEIFSPFHQKMNLSFMQALQKNTVRIYSLILYNCSKPPFKAKDEYRFSLHFLKDDLKISACGKVELKYFNTNITKVTEAVNHNSCLHKKIGIDRKGNIKNCPLMNESFGNIQKQSLEEALNQPDFRKYWDLTKDQIEICKDCEFRYVCTDCRAYTENTLKSKEGLNISKPLKCGYNPYTGVWEDWSKNPLKQEIFNSLEFR